MANKLDCFASTSTLNWRNKKEIKNLLVDKQIIYKNEVDLSYNGHRDHTGIKFQNCIINQIPSSKSIKKFIPNLTVMSISNCKLSKISGFDLMGFECLTDLYIYGCDLDYLPGDLFKHTQNLEIVDFANNKIKYIDNGILDPLRKLKIFRLTGNVNINAMYDILNNEGNVTLQQLKHEIKNKCQRTHELWKQIDKLKADKEAQKKEIVDLKLKCEKLEKTCETLLKQFRVVNERPKDFSIIIGANEFKVNKIALTAHSTVLENLIAENPEADRLELKDISEATFKEILNYMNDKSPPSENSNLVALFDASCRLKMGPLSEIVANRLMNQVNPENALDVMVICNKYKGYKELQLKALAEYQKTL